MTRAALAIDHKHQGRNCCQAVLLAYADRLSLSEVELMRLGAPFGMGMGNMEGPCGALCGAQMVAGLLSDTPRVPAKRIAELFAQRAGSLTCKTLKGVGCGRPLCSCDGCVSIAVEVAQEVLEGV